MADWTQRGSVLSLGGSGVTDDHFGYGVALSGDGNVLAVGAWGWSGGPFQAGKVIVYDRSGSSWTLRATITAADAGSNDNFGYSVALNEDGSVLVVGARMWEGASTNVGGVYTYDWGGSSYAARGSVLEASGTGHTNLNFGYAVALSADGAVLVVGATGSDTGGTDRGAVYTFDVSGSAWTQRGSALQAADAANSDFFGGAVALSSDGAILAVGAPAWESSGTNRGGVYIYDVSGSAWSARGSVLVPSDAADNDQFGFGVALDGAGGRLFASARFWEGSTGSNRGGVYQFDYSGSWAQTGSVIQAPDAADADFFSLLATNASGTDLIVGANAWEGSVADQGGVYTFDYTPPPSGSGAITIRPAVAGEGEFNSSTGATGTGSITIRPAVAGTGTFPTIIGNGEATIRPTVAGVARIDVGWAASLSSAPSRMSAALAVFEASWSAALSSAPSSLAAEAWAGAESRGALGVGYAASGIDRSAVAGTTITVSVAGITWPAQRVSIRKSLEQGDGESPYGHEAVEVAIPYTPAAFAALYAAALAGETLTIAAHYTLDDGSAYTRSLGDFAMTGASRPAGAGTVLLSGERATVYGASDADLELAGVSYETARSIRCAVDHQVFPGQFVVGRAAAFTAGGVTITLDAPSNTASMEVFARG